MKNTIKKENGGTSLNKSKKTLRVIITTSVETYPNNYLFMFFLYLYKSGQVICNHNNNCHKQKCHKLGSFIEINNEHNFNDLFFLI